MIHILDCTLRDGGYINDFDFGQQAIKKIIKKLNEAKIEIVECGFLQSEKADKDLSLFGKVSRVKQYLPEMISSMVVAMIAYGDIGIDEIELCDGKSVTGIRLTFHEKDIDDAFSFADKLIDKGYKVFIQPVGTTTYTDKALLQLIEKVNKMKPFAFYLVDTLGVLYKNDLLRTFYLIDNNLSPEIKVGFHSHNNLQLSFSNAQELMLMHTKREIIIDSSVFGMGRGAGNLCTELLTQYINENIENRYDLIPILEIMDEYIMPIYTNKPWGYSAPYYIAAINGCHPNYATYLMNRQTLCIRDINTIIKSIPSSKKQLYNADLIAELYLEYQKHMVNDSSVLDWLRQLCSGRDVLLLAPGKSLATHKNTITTFIETHNPIIFAINHIPNTFPYDCVFISNLKRFNSIEDAVKKLGKKLICTSNITDGDTVKTVNYTSYLNDDDVISDNAGLMLINVLRKIGIGKVALAGYDGFDTVGTDNYFDGKLNLNVQYKNREDMNTSMKIYFDNLRRAMEVEFITPSIYEGQ